MKTKVAIELVKPTFFLAFAMVVGILFWLATSNGVAGAATAVQSVGSGNWSDPTIWSNGTVPGAEDAVTIAEGTKVVYDVRSEAVLAGVDIKGTLYFSRAADTLLKTSDNIVVRPDGYLNMGTAEDFIPQNVKAEVTFVLPPGKHMTGAIPPDKMGFLAEDTGLWVFTRGRWDVNGAPVTRTWSKLAADAPKGAASLVVANDISDWRVGGSLVITQTSNPLQADSETFTNENEVRIITGVEQRPDGTSRLTLDRPLAFSHQGSGQERGEVGLLSRNVRFTTDIVGVDEKTLESLSQSARDGRTFAHTIYLYGAKGNVQYAEFKYMGNNRALARYPVHMHMMGDTSRGMIIRGNAVWHSGNRAYTLHESSGVLLEENVSFNTVSSPYFIELTRNPLSSTICEINLSYVQYAPQDNVFSHNLGVVSVPVASWNNLKGAPFDAAIFWLDQKNYQTLIGNVAVGAHAVGGPETGRSAGFQMDEVCDMDVLGKPDYLVLIGNEAHSNRASGLLTWCGNCKVREFAEFHFWRNGVAGFWWASYVNPVKLYNTRFFENGKQQILLWSTRAHLQDSEFVAGSKPTWVDNQKSIDIVAYVAPPLPEWPGRVVRSSFTGNGIDVTQAHTTDQCVLANQTIPVTLDQSCNSNYFEFLGDTFSGSAKTLDFGWHRNANAWFKVADSKGLPAGLSQRFYLNRKDQLDPANQGPESTRIIGDGSSTTYNASFDALVTPKSFDVDYPPQVSLEVQVNGDTATLTATVTDDRNVASVQFWQDEKQLGMFSASGKSVVKTMTVDLTGQERRFANFYVKAFDGYVFTPTAPETEPYIQNVYSKLVTVGPEIMPHHQPVVQRNQAPVVDAGPDQAITLPATATLNGVVSDDGLPSGAVTVSWSQVSGPAAVDLDNASAATTQARFAQAGEYVLRLSATDGELAASDQVTITVVSANQPPLVEAGPDATAVMHSPARVQLNGAASDDGLPSGVLSVQWSQASGPSAASFDDPAALDTGVTFNEAGAYVLRLTASDGVASSADELTVTVIPGNVAPVVDAGPDQTITLPAAATLNGVVSDDGLPTGAVTVSWSQVSGPAAAVFANTGAAITQVSFAQAGEYVLRLNATDGELAASDRVTITVAPEPVISPDAPAVEEKNLARNVTNIRASSRTHNAALTVLTDGSLDTKKYVGLAGGPQWIQLDLGDVFTLTRLNLRHYYGDGRTYRDVVVQLSTDGVTWTAVFNNDTDNSAKQGAGSDAAYAETAAGKEITLATPTTARYVRAWSNGSNKNGYNHYVEMEVYGFAK